MAALPNEAQGQRHRLISSVLTSPGLRPLSSLALPNDLLVDIGPGGRLLAQVQLPPTLTRLAILHPHYQFRALPMEQPQLHLRSFVSEAALGSIQHLPTLLPNLEHLSVVLSAADDCNLRAIAGLRGLRSLDLSRIMCRGGLVPALQALSDLTGLTRLSVSLGTRWGPPEVQLQALAFLSALDSLHCLRLELGSHAPADLLGWLLEQCPGLEDLTIEISPPTTAKTELVVPAGRLGGLRHLALDGPWLLRPPVGSCEVSFGGLRRLSLLLTLESCWQELRGRLAPVQGLRTCIFRYSYGSPVLGMPRASVGDLAGMVRSLGPSVRRVEFLCASLIFLDGFTADLLQELAKQLEPGVSEVVVRVPASACHVLRANLDARIRVVMDDRGVEGP